MELSYQEKSIFGSLFALIVAYGSYFSAMVRHWGDETGSLGRLVLAGDHDVMIETVYDIVLAVDSKPQPERRARHDDCQQGVSQRVFLSLLRRRNDHDLSLGLAA